MTGVVGTAVARCPGGDAVVVAEGPVGSPAYTPSASESARMANAVPKRRREFYSGRALAAQACAVFGEPRPSLEPDPRGAPQWPPRLVGSISHTDAWAAAAVASTPGVAAVGIDVEPLARLPEGVPSVVATPQEHAALAAVGLPVAFERLLFCAKETVFKAWWPLTQVWLDFLDVDVRVSADGTWTARGGRPALSIEWTGGWACVGDLLATAVVVPTGHLTSSDVSVVRRVVAR